jgi:hypothetical protein
MMIKTTEDYNSAVQNQTIIAPEKASKLVGKIIEVVCMKSLHGRMIWFHEPCKAVFKRNRREVQLHANDETYTYFINPRYTKEFPHILGLKELFYGFYQDGIDTYFLRNYDKGYAHIYKLKR